MRPFVVLWPVLATLTGGCSNQEVRMSGGSAGDYKRVGRAFVEALVTRDYDVAYALTSRDYRDSTSLKVLQTAFERIVPVDWKTAGPIEVGETIEDWEQVGLLLPAGLGGIVLLGEQFEAHGLRAFVFNFEIARDRRRADVEGMRLAGSPIGERPELGSRTIKLRLVSQYDGGASGRRNGCKFPL
jgi:hypothetical protein